MLNPTTSVNHALMTPRINDVQDSEYTSTYCYSAKYDRSIMTFQWLSLATFIIILCRVGDGNEVTSNRSVDYALLGLSFLSTMAPLMLKFGIPYCRHSLSSLIPVSVQPSVTNDVRIDSFPESNQNQLLTDSKSAIV